MHEAINSLLRRYKKAVRYMDNMTIPPAEKESYMAVFMGLVRDVKLLTKDMTVEQIDKMMNDAEVI
jgi:hypothetical protein